MTSFLLFTLYAPMASWGDIAVGEVRASWDRPSRSAILGLLAAGLGIDRADQRSHDALDDGYGIAVRLDYPGVPADDYQTAQSVTEKTVKAVRKGGPPTRLRLLAAVADADTKTMLSRRGYRQDALATVGAWARMNARWSLAELADALRRPRFVLYAGRKAHPLGLPVAPLIVEAATLGAALASRAAAPAHLDASRLGRPEGWRSEVSHDPCDGFPTGLLSQRREIRRDGSPQRTRWQFRERVVEVGIPEVEGGP